MPPLGTAPHRLGPGVWATNTGRRLTPAGSAYWEHHFRLGLTDGRGHITTPSIMLRPPVQPPAPTFKPGVAYHKPGFDTIVAARRGDRAAQQQISRYQQHQRYTKQAAQQADRMVSAQFGGAEQLAARANKVVNPVAGGVLTALSPYTTLKQGAHSVQHGDVLGAGLAAASLFPFGRGARAAKAAIEAERAAKLAEAAGPEAKVLGAMQGARPTIHAQEKLRSAERAARLAKGEEARQAAGGGVAGHYATKAALRGELPKINFSELEHLDNETLHKLTNAVYEHPDLKRFEKISLADAILNAHQGTLPRKFEIALMEKAFGPKAAEEFSSLPLHKHAFHAVAEIANVPRSILASADVSAPFRQALVAGAMHPKTFAKNLGPMFKDLVSERRYAENMRSIAERPSYPQMVESKLSLTDLGDVSHREELFMSNLAEKITGGKKFSFVRASSRAYVGFLNRMRADLFDHLREVSLGQGIPETPESLRNIAKIANWATGRGDLGWLEPAAVPLNTFLFSPRLFASRVNAINPLFYARLDPFARKQALLAITKLVGAGTTVLALAKLAGAKVNTDPTNSDFGKIKVGNTRFDIWGGHQQLVRLIAQIEQKKITSSTTGKTLRLKGGFGGMTRQDITKRFFEGKLAPTPSLINDWFKGTDFADKPFSWKREVVARSYPLLVQDMLDVYHQTGSIPKAAGVYGIGAFGIGVQTYGAKKPAAKKSKARKPSLSGGRKQKDWFVGTSSGGGSGGGSGGDWFVG